MSSEVLTSLVKSFRECYGALPRVAASAPGRVNLIGEHTDYNDGFVLPMAIGMRTYVLARVVATPEDVPIITVVSTNQPDSCVFKIDAALVPGQPKWANYVKGIFAGFLARGVKVPSMQLLVSSDVPLGGGLSSSASLEVAVATLIQHITGTKLSGPEKALLAQKAEHTFANMPCGIMDQYISAMAIEGHAMLLDCRSLDALQVPLDDPSIAVLIANSNLKHELTGSEYPERRAACEAAAKALGARALRDVTLDQLLKNKAKLTAMQFMRARHVVTEIARTEDAGEACRARDWKRFGKLMCESHTSMRDDYQISTEAIDALVDIAMSMASEGLVYGSRLTGGGFGGCTVSLIRADKAGEISRRLADGYNDATGLEATIFISRPGPGAQVEQL